MGDLRKIVASAIDSALCLLPDKMDTPEAVLMLLAISGQESNWEHRWQVVDKKRPWVRGPARSFWQGEKGGGMVHGVRTHKTTSSLAARLYAHFGVPPTDESIWLAIETNDVLAAALARLLLWTDPYRLPAVGDVEGAWQLYLRTWRPGAYTRGTEDQRAALRAKWAGYYQWAIEAVT